MNTRRSTGSDLCWLWSIFWSIKAWYAICFWKRKNCMYISHLCVVLRIHGHYAWATTHRRESTDADAWLHKHTHTHTPPHSSKVHLSRWQLDSCYGGVCQAESLACLAVARTSRETFWNTLRGCSASVGVCGRPCVYVCLVLWLCNFSKHPAAAWQGPAPLQFLPVLGRGRLGRELPILSGFQSTSNVHTAPASTWTPSLFCFSTHIWVRRHLFTSWYLRSVCSCRLGGMYCMLCFQTALQLYVCGMMLLRVLVWFWELHWKGQCKQNLFQQNRISQRSHVWSREVRGGTLSKTLSCPIKLKVLAISLNFLLGLQPGGVMLCYILVLMQSNYSHFHLSLRAHSPPSVFPSIFLPVCLSPFNASWRI